MGHGDSKKIIVKRAWVIPNPAKGHAISCSQMAHPASACDGNTGWLRFEIEATTEKDRIAERLSGSEALPVEQCLHEYGSS